MTLSRNSALPLDTIPSLTEQALEPLRDQSLDEALGQLEVGDEGDPKSTARRRMM